MIKKEGDKRGTYKPKEANKARLELYYLSITKDKEESSKSNKLN